MPDLDVFSKQEHLEDKQNPTQQSDTETNCNENINNVWKWKFLRLRIKR